MQKTVMIVEDAPTVREMVSFTLKSAGYEVVEAEDGADAAGKLDGQALDMLVVDLNMPKMDGFELIKKARANQAYKSVPIIILTIEADNTKKQKAKAIGANGWITKPFKPNQLLEVVKKVIG